MDRHGKKAKAKPATGNSQRSDLKAKAQGPLDQINQAGQTARAASESRVAPGQGAPGRSDPRSH